MGIGDRTEGELANSEHLNPFVVALWSLRHLGSRATWSPRGRSVGALWWWALCLFNSVREVGLGGFSRPRARSFSRSQGKPRVGLV